MICAYRAVVESTCTMIFMISYDRSARCKVAVLHVGVLGIIEYILELVVAVGW